MKKKIRFVVGATFMLATGVMFGNGYTNIGNTTDVTIAHAGSIGISDDGLWEFNTSGEIYEYLGNQKEITIPENITFDGVSYPVNSIDDTAIRRNSTVEVVNFSSSVSYMGFSYFNRCPNLKEINVPDSNPSFKVVDEILYTKNEDGDPNRLICIPPKATMTSISIADTVDDFNVDGVGANDTVEFVYLGKGMRYSGFESVFADFTALKQIEVSNQNDYYTSENGIMYNKDMTKLLLYPCKKEATSYTFPQTVTDISGVAFHNEVSNLKNINFTNYLGAAVDNTCNFDSVTLTSINGCSTIQEYDTLSAQTKDYIGHILMRLEFQPLIIKLCDEEIDRAIADNVTSDMTTYEKIKAMHDYVCRKVDYAPKGVDLYTDQYHCIPSIFLTDTTVCEGYALGFSLILDRLGITNHSINADNHAWNLIKLNDVWVAMDVCWDDGGNNYKYFLVNYDEMQEGQNPIDKAHVAIGVAGIARFEGYNLTHMPTDNVLPDYNPIFGDLNQDGVLNMTDVYTMANEVRGYAIMKQEGRKYYNILADMDRDGDIDSDDYDMLYAKVNA